MACITRTTQSVETTPDTPTPSSRPIPEDPLRRSMYCLVEEGTFCDVSFRVGPNREEVQAHKVVIASSSDVFATMLDKRWNTDVDGKRSKPNDEINIPNSNPQAFKLFLKFLYVEKLSSISISDSVELLSLANQYDIPNLLDRCSADLLNQLNLENCLEIYEATRLYPNLAVTDKAFKMLTRDFAEIVKSDQFLTVDQATLKDLLRSDEVKIDEVDFFKALVRWGENKAKDRESPCGNSAMTSLLQLIRYPLMGAETFAKEVVPTNVLSSEAALEMLAHLNGGISEADLKLLPAINTPRGNVSLDCSTSILLFDHVVRTISPSKITRRQFILKDNGHLKLQPEVRFKTDQSVTIYGVEVYGVTTAVEQTQSISPSAIVATEAKNLPYVQSVYIAISSGERPTSELDLNNCNTNASEDTWYIAHAGMAQVNMSYEVLLKEPLKTVPGQWYWISASRDIHLSPCFKRHGKSSRRYMGWTNRDMYAYPNVDPNCFATRIVENERRNVKVDLSYEHQNYITGSASVLLCSEYKQRLYSHGYTGCIRSLILNKRSPKV